MEHMSDGTACLSCLDVILIMRNLSSLGASRNLQ